MVSTTFSLLPADYELPDEELEESPEDSDKDEEVLETEVEEPEGDKPEDSEPDELVTLKARLESLEKQNTAIEDLRRSVGRIQSAIDKLDKADPNADLTKLQTSVSEEFGNVHDLLAQVVANADDTVFPDEFRSRIADLRDQALKRATADSLRKDVETQVKEALAKVLGAGKEGSTAAAPAPDQSSMKALEDEIVAEIRDYGLNDDEFDWKVAAGIYSSQGAIATRKWFREQIAEKQQETGNDTRRQERKTSAGKPAPKPDATAQTDTERLRKGKMALGDQVAYARRMGWLT